MAELEMLHGYVGEVKTQGSPFKLLQTIGHGVAALFLILAATIGLLTAIVIFLLRDEVRLFLFGT